MIDCMVVAGLYADAIAAVGMSIQEGRSNVVDDSGGTGHDVAAGISERLHGGLFHSYPAFFAIIIMLIHIEDDYSHYVANHRRKTQLERGGWQAGPE